MKAARKSRADKLMDARIEAARTWVNDSKLREGVDYLFYELGILIAEVEELKRELKPRRRGK